MFKAPTHLKQRGAEKGQSMKITVCIIFFMSFIYNAYCGDFKIYDGTLYTLKPDLSPYGVLPVDIIYGNYFWDKGNDKNLIPNTVKISKLQFDYKNKDFIIIDVEHWELRGDKNVVYLSLQKYIKLIETIRTKLPNALIGYYGLPVGRDYWRAIGSTKSNEYKEWQSENDQISILANHVDVALPSLYTFYDDPDGWVAYAKANIEEIRRIAPGKKILVFLWPRFHNSNKILGGMEISQNFWLLQLETVKKYADGIVLWGGWGEDGAKGRSRWKENASWWAVTKQFIENNHINSSLK